MADMNCLNNEDELVSQLDSQSQIDSELDSVAELSGDMQNVVEITPKLNGLTTEDIIVRVDNDEKTISAELTDGVKSVINNKAEKTEIPTKLSDLSNDVGFINNTVNNLVNYYTKSDTYSRSEVLELVGQIPRFSVQVVSTLPIENISETTIYLVAVHDVDENNYYEEYLYINNGWEMIGTTKIDLSEYLTVNTDQNVTGTKTFNKINLVGEDLVPIYEDREQTFNYEYTVENIPLTNPYGFQLNDSGYYESNNKGIHNSYAMCKVSFNMHIQGDLVIELINFAESNYDFGIFSQLDKELMLSNGEDIDNTVVYKSFKGIQSALPTTLTYNQVPAGEHFITIKYRKDTSADNGNDSLQFKILSPIGEVTIVIPELVGYEDFIAGLDVDSDKDLTYNGQKVLTPENIEGKVNLNKYQDIYITGTISNGTNSTSVNDIVQMESNISTNANKISTAMSGISSNSKKISEQKVQVSSISNVVDNLSKVATTGSYDDLEDKIEPSAKDNLGIIRAWIDEENYLCFSTESIAFRNKLKQDVLYIYGAENISFTNNVLTLD